MGSEAEFDALFSQTLRPRLQALQRRGRRWLNAFFALAFALGAFAIWMVFWEPLSPWWLVPPVLLLIATGAVAMGEITGLASAYRRDVLGPLYAHTFGANKHDADGGLPHEVLERSGLFPRLFGAQRGELCDRLELDHQGLPLVLCEAGIWLARDKQDNRSDELLFSGTLFELQARLPLAEPVVLLCGEVPAQPMPPGMHLDRLQRVKPGHPVLDDAVDVLCNTPSQARAALPQPVVQALARHVQQHPGRWRVVIDGHGMVGGIEGPRLTARLHPKAPLPDVSAARAQVQRVRDAIALVAALTEARPLAPR